MAVSSFADGSNYRRRTPTNSRRRVLASKPPATIKPAAPYNPYASGSTPQLQDPITNAIASGSTGAGFDDTVTPTGVNTDAPGAFQEETQGKTASGSPVPFNQPPPPPPPPPMSASDYSALSSGGVTAPAPSQTGVLPQGSMTPEQYRQASQMNSGNTGVQPPTSASDYAAISRGTPPVAPAAQPTMTASDYSAISRGTAGTSTPNNAFDDTVTPTGRSTEVPVVTPRDTPTVVNPYASGTSTPRTETQSAPFNPYASGTSTPEVETPRPTVVNPYASGTSTPNNTFDDTVTPTGQSTEVATSAPRDLPPMADAPTPTPAPFNPYASGTSTPQVETPRPTMTADDYQNILRGETQGIRDAIVTADDYNRLLSGQGDRIVEAVNQGRMTADDYQNILRGETQDIRDSIVTADDYNRLLSGTEDRITSAINQDRMTADDYQNILRGETQSIREAIDADKVTADDYARILGGELTARDERQAQERQAKEAAEAQERAAKQAIEDRMNLQFNDRLAETLESRRPISQITTADDYRNVSTGETPFEPPEILERFDVDQDLEKQLREQADMAARQGDDGLRTFAASPEFNPNAAGLENLARRQDAGLETFAARGSRYNRGAEQLRRQAGQRPSGTLQDRLEQAYMGRIDAANDPILASQIADQQLRQQEAQQGLVEQLSRYGVLRGGGDTAAALTRMAEGNERNRLALEAAAAQRRQGDLRDASAFDQARSSMDIAQRGQSLEERIGADRLLDTALARDVTRAGQTGQFQGVDTLAAQEQRQRMDIAGREQDLREDIGTQDIATSELGRDVTRAGLTGQFQDQDTLQAQEQALRMDLARADATGRFEGGMTADERDRDLARRISEAGVTGRFDTERRGVGTVDTIQRQAIESSLKNEQLNRALGRAGATGRFREEGDTADPTETLESRLRTAGLTGQLDNQLTLGGRQAEQDLIGSILAASDPELGGRTDALAEALTGRLGIEERSRVERRFQDEIAELGDDLSFDDFYRLAEEYADYPSITDALNEMMAEQTRKREEKEKEEEQKENVGLRGRRNRTQQNRST